MFNLEPYQMGYINLIETKNGKILEYDTPEEKELIEQIVNNLKSKSEKLGIKTKGFKNSTTTRTKRTRQKQLKTFVDEYLNYFKTQNSNKKTLMEYRNKLYFFIDYLNYKNIKTFKEVTLRVGSDLNDFLLSFPTNSKKYKELEELNLFEIVEKKDKILDKYSKFKKQTILNYFKVYKTFFDYLVQKEILDNNILLKVKPHKFNSNDKREYEHFKEEEIRDLIENIEEEDIKDSIILGYSLGCRLMEICNLRIEDISIFKDSYFIRIKDSKTRNGIREVPIPKILEEFFKTIIKDKRSEDFLLFNFEKSKNRNDSLQKKINRRIKKIIDNDNKVFHSLRGNFINNCYKNNIESVFTKTLSGHSTRDNLGFYKYNKALMSDNLKIEIINKIDLEFLKVVDYYKLKN
ncbi:tyrosine-type recombinase/integrase [Arcobacter sp. CECT 9188]|uniref:tyrosine-type recombinase/integrase n=1 Tax=Arcobacter sp. CECT 9188 TaxID=2044505 RepID=UPI002159DD9B|nr:tyrosine-type recombinase/integrase [Arcobacter sp. CECT 9188]